MVMSLNERVIEKSSLSSREAVERRMQEHHAIELEVLKREIVQCEHVIIDFNSQLAAARMSGDQSYESDVASWILEVKRELRDKAKVLLELEK